MLSNELVAQLAPFKLFNTKKALSLIYSSMCFSPGKVRGCSNAAVFEATLKHGIEQEIFVDTDKFLAIIASLPDKETVELWVDAEVLIWKCGPAKGRIATFSVEGMPTITRKKATNGWKPTPDFLVALELGSVSCDSAALSSQGLYGVVLDPTDEGLAVYSCDGITASYCETEAAGLVFDERITLRPDETKLLADLMTPKGQFFVGEKDVFYEDAFCRVHINQVLPLKEDIAGLLENYSQADTIAKIPPDRIKAFVKRAVAMAEHKKATSVAIGAEDGKLTLSFNEGVSSSDEWYLAEGLEELPDLPEIHVDALKLARALEHTSEIVLDHIENRIIVLRGHDPEFSYLISGRDGS